MKFIRDLLGKKRKEEATRQPAPIESLEQSYRDTIGSMVDSADGLALPDAASASDVLTSEVRVVDVNVAPPSAPAVNIWDLEDDDAGTALPEPTAAAAPAAQVVEPAVASAAAARSPARSRRTKTRLIGFDKSDGDVVD